MSTDRLKLCIPVTSRERYYGFAITITISAGICVTSTRDRDSCFNGGSRKLRERGRGEKRDWWFNLMEPRDHETW